MMRYITYLPVALTGILWLSRFFIRDAGVGVVNGLVVFLISWSLIVFMILPIGVRSQEETGDIIAGTEPGAPMAPDLARKAWWTTIATSVVWLIFFTLTETGAFAAMMPDNGFWD